MNFDKFKKLKPKRMDAPKDDFGYSDELLKLKSRPAFNKVFAVLSTVAAAIVIVTVVSLWAFIGRGIRIGPQNPAQAPANKPTHTASELIKDASITTLQRQAFFDMFANYQIIAMPEFLEGQKPEIEDMARYIYHLNPSDVNEPIIPNDIFASETKTLFGLEYETEGDVSVESTSIVEYPFAELIGYKVDGEVVTATAAVYYMWNLVDENSDELYPEDFAIAKSTITEGDGNFADITGIYTIKYLSDDGINPKMFLEMQKCAPPSDEFNEYCK